MFNLRRDLLHVLPQRYRRVLRDPRDLTLALKPFKLIKDQRDLLVLRDLGPVMVDEHSLDVVSRQLPVAVPVAIVERRPLIEGDPLCNPLAQALAGPQVAEHSVEEGREIAHQLIVREDAAFLVARKGVFVGEGGEEGGQTMPEVYVSEDAVTLQVVALEEEEGILVCDFLGQLEII